jgi:hypothetical protein
MAIYNPDDLVKSGFQGLIRYSGDCVSVEEKPGKYGDQLHVKFVNVLVHEHEDPNFDPSTVTEMTEFYPIKNKKNSVWEDILIAYQAAGVPLPDGPKGKRLTLQRVTLDKGKNEDTGEEYKSVQRLPVVGGGDAAGSSLEDVEIPEELLEGITGGNVAAAKRFIARNKAKFDPAVVAAARSGKLFEFLSEEGLITIDDDGNIS